MKSSAIHSPDPHCLLRWAEKGDQSAITDLIRRYGGLVTGVAERALGGNTPLAEEAAQTVFAAMARKAAALSRHPSLAAWLHRAALLEAAGLRRREISRRRILTTYTQTLVSPETSRAAEDGPDLDEALERLPSMDRLLLIRRYYEGRDFEDLTRITGKTEAALRKRTARALDRMQAILRRQGVKSTGAAMAAAMIRQAQARFSSGLLEKLSEGALAADASIMSPPLLRRVCSDFLRSHKTLAAAALLLLLSCMAGGYSLGSMQARADYSRHAGRALPPPPKTEERSGFPPGVPGRASGQSRPDIPRIIRNVGLHLNYVVDRHAYGPESGLVEEVADFGPESIPGALAFLPEYRAGLRPDELQVFEAVTGFIFAVWARSDPTAAREALTSPACLRMDGKVSAHALRMVMENWGEKDPAAALQWGLSLVAEGATPLETRRGVGPQLFSQWFEKDEEAAWREMVRRVPDQPELVSDALRFFIYQNEKGLAALKARLDPGADPAIRETAMRLMGNHLRWRAPESRWRVLDHMGLDPAIRNELLESL